MLAFALLSLICPMGVMLVLLLAVDVRKEPVRAALVVGLCFAAGFYGLRLDASNDIARHMALLHNYASVDFFHCFGAGHYDSLFAWDIWCWIIARTGDPYILQSSAAFVGYSIIAYVAFDSGARLGASRSATVTMFLATICAIPFMSIVVGIRSTIAVLLCALAGYLLYAKASGRLVPALLMACGILIHPGAAVCIVLVLVAPAIARAPMRGSLLCVVVTLFAAIIGQAVLPYVEGSANPVLAFLAGAIESLLGYTKDAADSWSVTHAASLNTRVNNLFTILWILFILLSVCFSHRQGKASRHLDCVDALVLACSLVSLSLSTVLLVNATRFVPFAFCLGSAALLRSSAALRCRAVADVSTLSVLTGTVVCAGLLALHCYSIAYGIVDPESFVGSLFLGLAGGVVVYDLLACRASDAMGSDGWPTCPEGQVA